MAESAIGAAFGLFGVVAIAHASGQALSPRDPALLESGRAVYQKHCASCHGVRAEGAPAWRQPDARGEMPAPPHDREGHTWKHSDAMLYRLVMHGWRDPFNKTDRLTMPAFAQVLSPGEARAVIIYLKTLWTPEQRQFQIEESKNGSFPPETK